MTDKAQGWVLAIDEASNAAGVSLWYDAVLVGHTVLKSESATDPISLRLQSQVRQLNQFLDGWLPDGDHIGRIIFEGVRSRIVTISIGAYLTCPRIRAKLSPKHSFVESRQWKKYAKSRGASQPLKDVKGLKALREIGYPVDDVGIRSDDTADSILIFLTWKERP